MSQNDWTISIIWNAVIYDLKVSKKKKNYGLKDNALL